MTYQFIEKTISDIYYQKLFPNINSLENICNISDDKSGEEESSSNYYIQYSENISFVILKYYIEIEKRINSNYAVTGWMLCLITHIR